MHFLYDSLIAPLELLLEFFFKLVQVITKNPGIAVISLSFIVTILTLPLYMVAERWQETERNIQNRLKSGIERIKQTFKGDEQYMILNAFYRENHYHPIMALRSSFSLLIQIPFFMAAYNFLSELDALNGYSFLFIKDFGSPDATFKIGSFAINILPIAMTLINCIAGYIYSKGHGAREQIQIYACAVVFLLLLYNSPSGLVIYWTMNNVLSLVKNIFYKLKNPRKAIYILCCIIAALFALSIFTFLKRIDAVYKAAFLLLSVLLVSYPVLIQFLSVFVEKNLVYFSNEPKRRRLIFIISSFALVILAGLAIPSILIESQPDLYCYIDDYTSPFPFIATTFAKALGIFFIWPLCFYLLFSTKIKNILTFLFSFAALFAVINTFGFSGNYGSIEPTLIFMEPQHFIPKLSTTIGNALVFVVIFAAILILLRKKIIFLQSVSAILLLSLLCISGMNCITIKNDFARMEEHSSTNNIEAIYHLSKTGKNVIFFMQDACLTPLIPEIFKESPEILKSFSGFTYYPNTTTLGSVTMTGSPGLFGGYDYTPFEINKREDKTLQEKHNEALLSLPILFNKEAGYDVTVSNLPYENYLEDPVSVMYKDYPFVNRINTTGKYSKLWFQHYGLTPTPHTSFLIKRNFICFSVFKMVPPLLRGVVYSHTYWIAHDPYDDLADFADNYSTLDFLPELTDFNSKNDSFIIIDNEVTHENSFIKSEEIPTKGESIWTDDDVFQIHISAFSKYADFFDYLRANGVWDNTRIIIVSDHGRALANHPLPDFFNSRLTATLLVKDFYSNNPIATDETFMTNADAPHLATNGIIENARNPFTNSPLEVQNKQDYIKIAVPNAESTRIRHNTTFKINPENWFTVHNNIYKKENWSHLDAKYNEN